MRTVTEPKTAEKRGLVCPRCGCCHFFVIYTRHITGGRIMRKRQCRYCGRSVLTYEALV